LAAVPDAVDANQIPACAAEERREINPRQSVFTRLHVVGMLCDRDARLDMRMGDVISIVGPTGSGKSAPINDIALFADANAPSRRRVLVNSAPPRRVLIRRSVFSKTGGVARR
jgi:ABC-type nitrate/sulfonate/bicarbonate transport system ATPase subunit